MTLEADHHTNSIMLSVQYGGGSLDLFRYERDVDDSPWKPRVFSSCTTGTANILLFSVGYCLIFEYIELVVLNPCNFW